jgi:hypothetical protein
VAHLRVPTAAQEGLVFLVKLSEQQMISLKQALRQASPALALPELMEQMASGVPLPDDQAVKIISVLASLYSAKVEKDLASDKFSEELFEALKRTGNKEFQLSDSRASQFRKDLQELLSLDESLGVTTRALAVMAEHEHIWQSGRMLTDLRPVFGLDPSETPKAAVVIHNLRIAYRDAGHLKEFFVALDSDDLSQLRRVLERATKKESSVRKLADKIGLPCLRTKTE